MVKDFAVLFDWFSIFQNKWMFHFGYLQLYAIVYFFYRLTKLIDKHMRIIMQVNLFYLSKTTLLMSYEI